MHVALGREYRGRRVHQGPVVYCAFEGQFGFQARVEAFRLRFLAEDPDAIPFFLQPLMLDLVQDHRELIGAIRRQVGPQPPVAIVLDTLNRSIRGSESKDEDMAAYIAAADAIRVAFNCIVIIVHHCGVAGDRPRGHTSLTGAIDVQLKVTRDAAGNIIVELELAKDGPQGETVVSRLESLEVGKDEDGEAITACIVVPSEGGRSPATTKQVTGAAKVALDLLRRAVDDAGETPPPSNHIPGDISAVRVDLWRKYAYEGSISEGDTPEARKKAFSRASTKLQAAGLIGKWGEWVWLV
jgi:hypothetical protein